LLFVYQDLKVFHKLIEGLRKHASKEGLSDDQVIAEWQLYETAEDETRSESCICGKDELRYEWQGSISPTYLRTALTRKAPKSVRIQSSCLYLFMLLGFTLAKVVPNLKC